jgi:hypothetical protein
MEPMLQTLQDLDPVITRHIEIQQHQIRKWERVPIAEPANATHIRDGLQPIMGDPNHADSIDTTKLVAQELAFVFRILNDQCPQRARSRSHMRERVVGAFLGGAVTLILVVSSEGEHNDCVIVCNCTKEVSVRKLQKRMEIVSKWWNFAGLSKPLIPSIWNWFWRSVAIVQEWGEVRFLRLAQLH